MEKKSAAKANDVEKVSPGWLLPPWVIDRFRDFVKARGLGDIQLNSAAAHYLWTQMPPQLREEATTAVSGHEDLEWWKVFRAALDKSLRELPPVQ